MPVLRFGPFQGTLPRVAPRFLPEGAAQVAENTKLWSGRIEPFKGPRFVATPKNGDATRTLHRYVVDGTEYWFDWAEDVDIVPGALGNDTLSRRYYTGDGKPKKTGSDIAIPAAADGTLPARWYWMGVKAPYLKPTVDNQSGGSGTQETVIYFHTFITGWGEESAPGIVSDDFTAYANRASLRFTRALPSFTFQDADVDVSANTIAKSDWEGDGSGQVHAYGLVQLSSSGTLPGNVATVTDYWVIPVDDGHISLATSFLNALAGIAVDITSAAGGGTHTVKQYGPDGRYNITGWRLYRSNTGSDDTAFEFVMEVQGLSGTVNYLLNDGTISTGDAVQVTDAVANDHLGDACTTFDFDEPPDDLSGLRVLPGGFLTGFSPSLKQQLWSMPYFPYAWPDTADYRRTLPFNPVACGTVGTRTVVGTDGKPTVFDGVSPDALTPTHLDDGQAVLNKASLIETPLGVLWASPDGFYLVGLGGGILLTRGGLTKDNWKLLHPETMRCAVYDGRIYAAFNPQGLSEYQIFVFDPNDSDPRFITLDVSTLVLYPEILSDALYLVLDGQIQEWDSDPFTPLAWRYMTAIRREAQPTNKAALQVVSDFGGGVLANGETVAEYEEAIEEIEAANAALLADGNQWWAAFGTGAFGMGAFAGDFLSDVPPSLSQGVTVEVYGDGVLRATRVVTSTKPVKLPTGYRASAWHLQASSSNQVEELILANSVPELQEV